jgi:DNA-binding MarR family transcriptional regulator
MKTYFIFNDSPGYLISRAKALMQIEFNNEIRKRGINATAEQWGLLNHINQNPGLTQSALAEVSLKDKTNITRMLDVLEKNGCVERKDSPKDRRSYHIFITDKGKELISSLIPVARLVNSKSLFEFTDEESRRLINKIKKIISNLE